MRFFLYFKDLVVPGILLSLTLIFPHLASGQSANLGTCDSSNDRRWKYDFAPLGDKTMYFCDANNSLWFPSGFQANSTCSAVDEAKMRYNTGIGEYEYCDGSSWNSMKAKQYITCNGGSKPGVAGQMIFDAVYGQMLFCDGTWWWGMGASIQVVNNLTVDFPYEALIIKVWGNGGGGGGSSDQTTTDGAGGAGGTSYVTYNSGYPKTATITGFPKTATITGYPKTATISNASPGVVTITGHGLVANQSLTFSTTNTLPAPLVAGTTYYVKTVLTANTFTVSATSGGTVINTTSNGNGTHSVMATEPGIVTATAHGLSVNQAITFTTTGTLPSPLATGTTYYVQSVLTADTFTVSATSGGAVINTTTAGSGTHSVDLATPTAGVITVTAHGLSVGQSLVFTTTGTLPSPLTQGATYYVQSVPTANTFTVSATSGGAAINTTSAGSGTHSVNIFSLNYGATISQASPGVVTSAGHGFLANQMVIFKTSGTLPTPLTADTIYYVKTVTGNDTFTVSATSGGTVINTTSAGSGTHTVYSNTFRVLANGGGGGLKGSANPSTGGAGGVGGSGYDSTVTGNAGGDGSTTTTTSGAGAVAPQAPGGVGAASVTAGASQCLAGLAGTNNRGQGGSGASDNSANAGAGRAGGGGGSGALVIKKFTTGQIIQNATLDLTRATAATGGVAGGGCVGGAGKQGKTVFLYW